MKGFPPPIWTVCMRSKGYILAFLAVILSNTTTFHRTWFELNDRGQETKLEIVDDEFVRLCVIFEKDRKFRSQTASMGLSSMAPIWIIPSAWPFLCIRIIKFQTVGAGIVSVENEDNWSMFLYFLRSHLQLASAFVIIYRNKGLIDAVQTTVPDASHVFLLSASDGKS